MNQSLTNCKIEINPDLNNNLPHYFYPKDSHHSDLLIRIDSKISWFASFEQSSCRTGLTDILALPDPDKALVIAKGRGYIIDSITPEFFIELSITPIIFAKICPKSSIVVIISNTEVFGVTQNGVKWRTGRIALDEIKFESIENKYIIVKIWNDRHEKNELITIDSEDGSIVSKNSTLILLKTNQNLLN